MDEIIKCSDCENHRKFRWSDDWFCKATGDNIDYNNLTNKVPGWCPINSSMPIDPDHEDLDLLCNSLNAEAGRARRQHQVQLSFYLLRAQAAISRLRERLEEATQHG